MSRNAQLRSLLRQKRGEKEVKIVHKLAKYSSRGELSCAICRVMISSATLWDAHLTSKKHKESFTRLKQRILQKKKSEQKPKKTTPASSSSSSSSSSNQTATAPSESSTTDSKQSAKPTKVEEELPANFFDSSRGSESSSQSSQSQPSEAPITGSVTTAPTSAVSSSEPVPEGGVAPLPQGFFDETPQELQIDFSQELAAFSKDMNQFKQQRIAEQKITHRKLIEYRKKEAQMETSDLKNWLNAVKQNVTSKREKIGSRKRKAQSMQAEEKVGAVAVEPATAPEQPPVTASADSTQGQPEEEDGDSDEDDDWDFDPEEICGWRSKKTKTD